VQMIRKIKEYLQENRFIMILLILFLLGALGFGIYEVIYHTNNAQKQESYEQIWLDARSVVTIDTETEATEETEPTPLDLFLAEGDNMSKYGAYLSGGAMDFEVLHTYNEDVIGYILIPDTKVSYPIVQSVDNAYYLNHNMDGSKGYPGCIFAENYNSPALDDPVNIVYGHNMRNNSMFGALDEYRKEEYRNEHPYIIVYLPEEVRVYEVVVASKYSDRHLLSDCFVQEAGGTYTFQGFVGNEGLGFTEELEAYNAKGSYVAAEQVEESDQILVLSTCSSGNMRYIVGAKRIL